MTGYLSDHERTETRYREWLNTISLSIAGISLFIRHWQKEPYFKIEDVLPHLRKAFNSDFYSNNLYQLEEKIFDNDIQGKLWDKIVDCAINYSLDQDTFTIEDYLTVEAQSNNNSPQISISTLRRAQLSVIKLILTTLEEYNINHEMDQSKIIEELKTLTMSKKIPQNLINGLIKRFGVEIYTKIYPLPSEEVDKRINRKSNDISISIYDIAQIFHRGGIFKKQYFERIIKLADEKAREYMRGFIYSSGKEVNPITRTISINDLFILDEEMNPMNINYQNVAMPDEILHSKINRVKNILTPEELQKLYNIFADFGIVAQ